MIGTPEHRVPADLAGSRRDTAILLVGTAKEFGIDQHEIALANGDFLISTRLRDVLYDEGVLEKTSGNRAAKKDSQKEQR